MDNGKRHYTIKGKRLGDTCIIISENELPIGKGSFGLVKKAYNMEKPD
jgi:hypothetical protein